MKIKKTVEVKFTDEELVQIIANGVLQLGINETWELVSSYPGINNYTFRIIKKDTGDSSEDHS